MIQNTSHKIRNLLLTYEKKKLLYNQTAHSNLLIPFDILGNLVNMIQLTIQQHLMSIKKSFFIIIFTIIFIALIEIESPNLQSLEWTKRNSQYSIQHKEQTINIKTAKIQDSTFYEFKLKYQKEYLNAEEELFRSIVYLKNKDKINQHNSRIQRKFNMAINFYADLTPQQFSAIYTTLYSSNDHIKTYSKNLVSKKLSDNTIYSQQYSTLSEENHQQIQNYVMKQRQNKLNYIVNQNPEFVILDSIFNSTLFNKKTFPLKQSLSNDTSIATTSNIASNSSDGNFSSLVIDWTLHTGKIRYQGICGACYTFATSDVVASLYSIYKFGFFIPLSTQQVIDCSTNGLTYGCNGGFLQGSYSYMQMKGILTDVNYPYVSTVSGVEGTCKRDGGSFKITSFKNVQEGDCTALVNQLNYGPVSIGIAGYRLQFYEDGIFNDCNSYVDHAVMLIGYKGGVGWKIKNSWGPQWGMEGFAWIEDGNNCGICNMAVAAKL